jgi:rhodanese-related sulfurtransferase
MESYTTVDRLTLTKMIAQAKPDNLDRKEGFALVNVLGPESFAKEHIPWSINIPQGKEDDFEKRFAKGKEIVVYCASSECDASSGAARELAQRGFTAVRDYGGGLQDWKAGRQPAVPAR